MIFKKNNGIIKKKIGWYYENIRKQMEKKFKILKKGAIIMSLIHKFENEDDFELLNAKLVRVAWGETPLMVYKKI